MDYLTAGEAAEALRISVPTVKRYIYEGKLKSAKLPGGQHRIPKSEIERLLTPSQGAGDQELTDVLPEPSTDERISVLERWLTEVDQEVNRLAATIEVMSHYCRLCTENQLDKTESEEDSTERRVLILGPGCRKCEALYERTTQVLQAMGRTDVRAEQVKDLDEITAFGPVVTPALVVDGSVVLSGRLPTETALRSLLTRHLD